MSEESCSTQSEEEKREMVLASARERINCVLEMKDSGWKDVLIIGHENFPDAALAYEVGENHFWVNNLGAVVSGCGRRALAQLSCIAVEEGKNCIGLEPVNTKESYYLDLGFEDKGLVGNKKLFELEGKALEKLAEEGTERNKLQSAVWKSAVNSLQLVAKHDHLRKDLEVFFNDDGGDKKLSQLAGVSYSDSGNSIRVEALGSLIPGEGRKLLARLASMAMKNQKSITLCPEPFCAFYLEKLISYYEDLGFVWTHKNKKKMVLRGEGLEKLALEFVGGKNEK